MQDSNNMFILQNGGFGLSLFNHCGIFIYFRFMLLKAKLIRWILARGPQRFKKRTATKLLGGYGKMVNIKFNPGEKYLLATVELAGEKEPITIEITDYDLIDDDDTGIVVKQATADREWINRLINDLLIGKHIPVPGDKLKLIRGILKK